jgi:long-chain acyl-CoA synthetase
VGTYEGALGRVSPFGARQEGESAVDSRVGVGAPRVLSGPRLVLPPEDCLTVPGLLLDVVKRRGSHVALRAKHFGIYQNVTWSELLDRVAAIGLGFCALGVKPQERVAIVGDPLAEWLLSDFAAQCIGAISYGLYPTSSRDEVEFVLRHGGASVLVAEDQEHVDKVLPLLDRLPDLKKIIRR